MATEANWKEIDITPTWDGVSLMMQRAIRRAAKKPQSAEVDSICEVIGSMGDSLAMLIKDREDLLQRLSWNEQADQGGSRPKTWDEVIDRFLKKHGIDTNEETQS